MQRLGRHEKVVSESSRKKVLDGGFGAIRVVGYCWSVEKGLGREQNIV